MLGYKKGNTKLLTGQIPLHYPADRVYLDGDTTKSVQDKCARKADLTNLDLTGTTNTTGSAITGGTFFYLNGTLVRAKTAIASGATFTLNTNYEVVPNGALNYPLIKSKTVSGTTTANGNIALGLTSDNVVLAVTRPSSGNSAVAYLYNTDWYATVCDSNGTSFNAVPNTSVNLTVYYM